MFTAVKRKPRRNNRGFIQITLFKFLRALAATKTSSKFALFAGHFVVSVCDIPPCNVSHPSIIAIAVMSAAFTPTCLKRFEKLRVSPFPVFDVLVGENKRCSVTVSYSHIIPLARRIRIGTNGIINNIKCTLL
jgi:hypothetical protein